MLSFIRWLKLLIPSLVIAGAVSWLAAWLAG